MSDAPNTPTPPEANDAANIEAIREKIVGTRASIPQLARALGVTERTIYNLIDQYRIEYVKVCNQRLVEPAAIRAAVLRDQANTPARRPGRPKRAA